MTNFASLCILSYNRPEYLEKTLMSLKENTTEPYQLIIHDDGSEPYSGKMADVLYGELCEDALLIQNPPGWNEGQGVALNRMFNIAKGDPIIKLDADLEYTPGWLGEVNKILDENLEFIRKGIEPFIGLLGLLHYWHDPVDSDKTLIQNHHNWSERTHILGSGFALRRETYDLLGPFSEYSDAFAEDWEMQRRVAKSGTWKCALPVADLVKNVGMGIGRSTVVTEDGSVAKIHKSPYIINDQKT